MTFKIGDVVLLKGNSVPAMTVCGAPASKIDRQYFLCKWFDSDNILHSEEFLQDTLILIPQEEI